MKLLICLVTYNRLEYTKRTLHSLWKSLTDDADYLLVVSDNASTDGTREYLRGAKDHSGRINIVLLNPENYYPGKATNLGWAAGLEVYDATHLMRLDNDMQLTRGWNRRVEAYFDAIPELGQLGLEHEAIETPEAALHKRVINGLAINEWPGCVGGPAVIPRKIYDLGLRYDETPWHKFQANSPAMQEDSKFSQAIKAKGYLVGHAEEELGRTFATPQNWSDYPDYYRKTMTERGYDYLLDHIKEKEE
jgi:glycosyltransferase involved in cell wall biosynthesis